jgi:hypothetical protein
MDMSIGSRVIDDPLANPWLAIMAQRKEVGGHVQKINGDAA